MKCIAIANQKGGCGKTTTAINLAAALSQNGRRTLLIDLDPQAHASLGLNFEHQDSMYNVISKLTPRKLTINDIIKSVEERFDIAPSNILVGTLEQELADEIGRELKLTEIIRDIEDRYDYILIDCPPSLGFLTINAIRAAHEVMIPVETSRFSLQGVAHLLDIIRLIRDRLNHPVAYRLLITMFDSRLRHSFAMLGDIRERFAGQLYETIIHVNVKLKESALEGQTVLRFDKYCRGSKDYLSLAKEIIAMDQAQVKEEESKAVEAVQDKAALKRPSPAAQEEPQPVREAVAQQNTQDTSDAIEFSIGVPEVVAQQRWATVAKLQTETEIREASTKSAAVGDQTSQSGQTQQGGFRPLSEKMAGLVKEGQQAMQLITFTLKAPQARSVYLTGSFNDWSLDENCRMRRQEDGTWKVQIPLKPGVYKYQFIVDGRWQEDPENPRQERNSFGDINSLIEVPAHAAV